MAQAIFPVHFAVKSALLADLFCMLWGSESKGFQTLEPCAPMVLWLLGALEALTLEAIGHTVGLYI